ncbi:MAG: hypothetical protein ACLGIW_13860, partial [Gammaproteobacteria bacterium]
VCLLRRRFTCRAPRRDLPARLSALAGQLRFPARPHGRLAPQRCIFEPVFGAARHFSAASEKS